MLKFIIEHIRDIFNCGLLILTFMLSTPVTRNKLLDVKFSKLKIVAITLGIGYLVGCLVWEGIWYAEIISNTEEGHTLMEKLVGHFH